MIGPANDTRTPFHRQRSMGILGEIKLVHPSETIGIRAYDCVVSGRRYVTFVR
jgi:hypothetical protein